MPDPSHLMLIDRFYHEMWDRFDKGLFSDILTEDFRFRGSLGQHANGWEEFGAYVDFVQAAFPDFTNHVEEVVSEGDRAFARLTYQATHRGELFGIAGTGKRVEYAGTALFRFRGDRIAEVWVLGDLYGLIRQLESSA